MTTDDRLKMINALLESKTSIAQVNGDSNLLLHMTNLGYTLRYETESGKEFGDWILRCPGAGFVAIRNVEHLRQFFIG